MQKTAATINCQNCQATNQEKNIFCENCRSRLQKRYLWAVGEGRLGQALGSGRYILKEQQRIFLDTKPGEAPEVPEVEIPDRIVPYLRLFPYRLHVPQPYALVSKDRGSKKSILLLEGGPIDIRKIEQGETADPLMPSLTSQWPQASAMRQLNWLWQMAQLWQALKNQGVVGTLLDEQMLRVEGPLVRLLELQYDKKSVRELKNLGKLWSKWVGEAQPKIREFLQQLSDKLLKEELDGEGLVAQLNYALTHCSVSQSVVCEIATRTDKGPSRGRNEDACYPRSGSVVKPIMLSTQSRNYALAIVCDGIGGHEGGNVASTLAIDTIQKQIEDLPGASSEGNRLHLYEELDQAVRDANDEISQRNDEEDRQERQRMGTTVVMTLVHGYRAYVTHVGDSRVYWISRSGCYQMTLDDDVASRDVRLGYSFYREALERITSGSLVQALGMSSSTNLHPTVGSLILEEDSVFLLCSDGLSDHDRVEEHWQAEIMPLLENKINVATATENLVNIANRENGHDNVTVGLVYCRVEPKDGTVQPLTDLASPDQLSPSAETGKMIWQVGRTPKNNIGGSQTSSVPTREISPRRSGTSILGLLVGILFLLSLGGVLTYLLIPLIPPEIIERVKLPQKWEEQIRKLLPPVPDSKSTPVNQPANKQNEPESNKNGETEPTPEPTPEPNP